LLLEGGGTLGEIEQFGRRVNADLHEVTDRLTHEEMGLNVLRRQLLGCEESGRGFPDLAALGV
jgi:hypothetical protein